MPGPTKLTQAQLAKHRPNRVPWYFEHIGNDEVVIHITQKNGRKHQFKVWARYFQAILNYPELYSFCASPMSAKKPEGKYYCKISCVGQSQYLHRFIRQFDITADRPQIHHISGDCTDHTPQNLEAVSAKDNLAARTMPAKPKK